MENEDLLKIEKACLVIPQSIVISSTPRGMFLKLIRQ